MAKSARKKKSTDPVINTNVHIGTISSEDLKKAYKCSCCGSVRSKPSGFFPKTNSPLADANKGYAHICWDCVNKYYERMTDLYNGDESLACERICQMLDIYYNEDAFATSRRVNNSRMRSYMSRMNQLQYEGRTYVDTIIDRHTNTILTEDDALKSGADAADIRKWGFAFGKEDYDFLNAELADWEARCVVDGKSREAYVKDVCILTLQQNKALSAGQIDLYQKITEARQKTLDRAELSPKVAVAKDRENEKPIGVMIEMFENERPISDPLPEWKDVDGIMKLILVYFIGHLCKMLNLKNKYAQMYEDEMDKYRVTIPELDDADAEDVFDYVFENGSFDLGGGDSAP